MKVTKCPGVEGRRCGFPIMVLQGEPDGQRLCFTCRNGIPLEPPPDTTPKKKRLSSARRKKR